MFRLVLMISAVLAMLATECRAWNATGHRTIASVIWRRLAEERRAELDELLTHHPRYQQDFVEWFPESVREDDPMERAEWSLQQASVWPDIVRSGPPERQSFNRPTWHYLPKGFFFDDATADFKASAEAGMNTKLDPVGGTENHDLNGPQAFKANLSLLNDLTASKPDRAVALCWVLHIGQDLHQPCHTASLCLPRLFPRGDRGANDIRTEQQGNLHAVWDGPLGPDDGYEHCRDLAIVLLGSAEPGVVNEEVGGVEAEIVKWLHEGWTLERESVYIGELKEAILAAETGEAPLPTLKLTEDYLRNVRKVSNQRILRSGIRLAHLLQ